MAESRFDQIVQRDMQDAEIAPHYSRSSYSIGAVQNLLNAIDDRRRELGMTKAELARRAGIHPVALRRLLTSGEGNPTLKTLFDVMYVLGLRMQIDQAPEVLGNGAAERRPKVPRKSPIRLAHR